MPASRCHGLLIATATAVLAAAAYLAYALAHHQNRRELVTRSILVSAFALWAIVQLAPGFSHVALLNDITIPVSYTHLTLPTNREV